MNEPDNLTGWVDDANYIWVRVDDCPGSRGCWWPRMPTGVGTSRSWDEFEESEGFGWGPLTAASGELTTETIDLVRRERSR